MGFFSLVERRRGTGANSEGEGVGLDFSSEFADRGKRKRLFLGIVLPSVSRLTSYDMPDGLTLTISPVESHSFEKTF